jgi:hypothetical protein
MIQQAVLSVPTCPCQVLEQWEDTLPADQVLRHFVAVVVRGPEHATIVDKSLQGVLRDEAQRQAVAVALAVATVPGLAGTPGALQARYTPGRTLELSMPALHVSKRHKRLLQGACDARLGLLKVKVR